MQEMFFEKEKKMITICGLELSVKVESYITEVPV
jgi:hypothetical protein